MEFKKDQRFLCVSNIHGNRELRILTIEQKHIMCRFKGCIPFVRSIKEFPGYLERLQAQEIITKIKSLN